MSGPRAKRRPASLKRTHGGVDPASEPVSSHGDRGPAGDAGNGSSADHAGVLETDAEERELLEAIQQYQRASKRMFPTWSEVLEIMQQLGYRKPD